MHKSGAAFPTPSEYMIIAILHHPRRRAATWEMMISSRKPQAVEKWRILDMQRTSPFKPRPHQVLDEE